MEVEANVESVALVQASDSNGLGQAGADGDVDEWKAETLA